MQGSPDGGAAQAGPTFLDNRDELKAFLGDAANEGSVAKTLLKTSDRVIARVTDGIYREPASAFRELISNAWDADASEVSIVTDAPRFSRIYVRDDGIGMSHETLARLLHSIGGSAKRTDEGQELGVTDSQDSDRTPGGRLLIGKIGIGLFSVSQLARRFKIITKAKGSNYRLHAEIYLRTYSEEGVDDEHHDDDDTFINGEVLLYREPEVNTDAHGTDIILDDLKSRVRDLLRDGQRWQDIKDKEEAIFSGDFETANSIRAERPTYHCGWIEQLPTDPDAPVQLTKAPALPWSTDTAANSRMAALVEAVQNETSRLERPALETTLDYYLGMLWKLSLSAPIQYVNKHPFDLTRSDNVRLFWLSNEARGQAKELPLPGTQTVREAVRAHAPGNPVLESGEQEAGFKVLIDGVELKRPITFKFVQTDRRGLDKAMLFVGRYTPNLSIIDKNQRGGDIGLEGYLYWNGRIIPKENNGSLVRIRGASGALFDNTFFKYQVAEITRLRQITSEIFIQRGLDAALNIDRESFNYAHPHVQIVSNWLHRGLRQLTNKHKELTQKSREIRRLDEVTAYSGDLENHIQETWKTRRYNEEPPEISISEDLNASRAARGQGYLSLVRSEIPSLNLLNVHEQSARDEKAKALASVLTAYGLFEDRDYETQQAIIEAILRIFYGSPRP